MELVLWLQNLYIKGAVRSKVLHRPGPQYGLMILRKWEMSVSEMDAVRRGKCSAEIKRCRNTSAAASDCVSSLMIFLKYLVHSLIEWPTKHFRVIPTSFHRDVFKAAHNDGS